MPESEGGGGGGSWYQELLHSRTAGAESVNSISLQPGTRSCCIPELLALKALTQSNGSLAVFGNCSREQSPEDVCCMHHYHKVAVLKGLRQRTDEHD